MFKAISLILSILFCASCSNTQINYYDFKMDNKNAGYFMIEEKPELVKMSAVFKMDEEISVNEFQVKIEENRVTAYKIGENDWIDFNYGINFYPTSAYPLLVKNVRNKVVYIAVHEGKNEVLGATELIRKGDIVTEVRDNKVVRKFWLDGNKIIKIDWGGATSTLKDTLEQAAQGTGLAKASN